MGPPGPPGDEGKKFKTTHQPLLRPKPGQESLKSFFAFSVPLKVQWGKRVLKANVETLANRVQRANLVQDTEPSFLENLDPRASEVCISRYVTNDTTIDSPFLS